MTDNYVTSIKLTNHQYDELWNRLLQEWGNKIVISWVLKRELGFTVRSSTEWSDDYYKSSRIFYLDFYKDKEKVAFMLKYF